MLIVFVSKVEGYSGTKEAAVEPRGERRKWESGMEANAQMKPKGGVKLECGSPGGIASSLSLSLSLPHLSLRVRPIAHYGWGKSRVS